jgi:hypothetical protein
MKKLLFFLFCLIAFPTYGQINANPTYGQGTWVPGVTASSTAGTPAYTTHVGSYITVGNWVYVQFTIVLSGWTGSPSGNVSITNLPYAATGTANDNGGCQITQYTVTGLASSNYGIAATIAPSATTAVLQSEGNTGTANVTAAQTGTTPTLIGFCTYRI